MVLESDTMAQEAAVLIVDDDPGVCSAMKRSLRGTAPRVLTASSGQAGLDLLAAEEVAVVISDYQMPGMNGVEFLARVKEGWPKVQRIMLTGEANAEMIEELVNESEVYRFLTKPWSQAQVRGIITACYETIRLQQANEQYEQQLAERNRQLAEINRNLEKMVEARSRALVQAEKMAALGRMAGGVAHEINNPLGGILAMVQLQKRGLESGEWLETLEAIEQCTVRCRNIVDSLLGFSRQQRVDNLTPVDLNRVVEVALTIVRLEPRAKMADIVFEPSSEDCRASGQSGLLEQVVVNLIQNGLQASDYAAPVVIRTERGDDRCRIHVDDEGPGIPPEILSSIFEPFFTTKDPGEGTGLGLAISYGIADEHRGTLTAANREGRGARFTLDLPERDTNIEGKDGHD
jgi:C4-dicarboxylate-specific signal transduction histidine kinase